MRITSEARFALLLSIGVFIAGAVRADEPASPAATGLRQIATSPPPGDREETLVSGELEHGGYGGPRLAYGRIAGHDAVHLGGEGGWIVNHHFILGGAAYGLVTSQPTPGAFAATDDLNMGYGGVVVGYTVLPSRVAHPTFTLLVGGGSLGTRAHHSGAKTDLADSFFVLEPAATVDLNVARHFRLGVALSYRWVRGVEMEAISNSDLSGLFGSMALKFGKF